MLPIAADVQCTGGIQQPVRSGLPTTGVAAPSHQPVWPR
jgi:hypothetical protein